jgi:serine/threonine-protein kinase
MAIDHTGGLGPGSHLGRYVVVRRIGSGGMGDVYEGQHVELRKRVAIKTLRPDRARDPEARARFLREGQAAVRVRHENVVEVLDVGTHDDVPYLVMEFLEGLDLAAWIARQGAMPPETVTEMMLPVLAAVAAAHEEGVLHRDLKPSNIFLARTRDGGLQPKVVDFGISWVASEQDGGVTSANVLLGTPAYMSPEQTRGAREVSAASDQYALGAILYECVTGRSAFEPGPVLAMALKVSQGQFPRPRALRPELDPAFEAVILRAMALDASQRFASVRELGRALLPFAGARGRMLWETVFDGAARGAGVRVEGVGSLVPPRSPTTLGSSVQERALARGNRARDYRIPLVLLAVLIGMLTTFAGVTLARGRRTATASRYDVSITAEPASAAFTLDGENAGAGALHRAFTADGTAHVLTVSAPGYAPQEVMFVNAPPRETRVVLRAHPSEAPREERAAGTQPTTPVVVTPPVVTNATHLATPPRHRHVNERPAAVRPVTRAAGVPAGGARGVMGTNGVGIRKG